MKKLILLFLMFVLVCGFSFAQSEGKSIKEPVAVYEVEYLVHGEWYLDASWYFGHGGLKLEVYENEYLILTGYDGDFEMPILYGDWENPDADYWYETPYLKYEGMIKGLKTPDVYLWAMDFMKNSDHDRAFVKYVKIDAGIEILSTHNNTGFILKYKAE